MKNKKLIVKKIIYHSSTMKKLLLLILVICGLGTAVNAQNLVSEEDIAKMNLSAKDSLMVTYMDGYVSQLRKPRYQLFKTQNTWTFLKLDTLLGLIWQVQFSVKGDEYRFEEVLNKDWLVSSLYDEMITGRFTLYPTDNMYNFILLDQIDGRCWQVQWRSNSSERMILRIR